jgi:hypothetical protein
MKLAEALADRADLQRRVEQMRMRLQASARVQEDEIPPARGASSTPLSSRPTGRPISSSRVRRERR